MTEKCKMCGMELLPYEREYSIGVYSKKRTKVIRLKAFCDELCRAYFQKRVCADEFDTPLSE